MTSYHQGLPNWRELKNFTLRAVVLVGDVFFIGSAYLSAYMIRFHGDFLLSIFPADKGIPSIKIYFTAAPVVLFMWVLALFWVGAYKRLNLGALDEVFRLIQGSFVGTFLAMSAMFLYRDYSYSRLVFGMGGGLSLFLIYGWRQFLKVGYLFWIRRNRIPHRVLVLGNGYLSTALKKILDRQGDRAVLRLNVFNPEAIQKTIVRSRIKEVLVAQPNFNHQASVELANFCDQRGVKFRLLPDILEIRMGQVVIDDSLGVPTFQLKPISLHGSAFVIKRFMDVFLSTFFIGIFFIPLSLVALLIKWSSKGPVFYRQDRLGYGGREFEFLKFRTMVLEADKLLEKLKEKSDRPGPVFKMKNDPRVTGIGKILRRLSIDEIPQLINVLKGEMSLVGPRPQVLWETRNYDEAAKKRLNVLPGITGLWQVSGRAELTFNEMIELDIYYIEHWSPGLDLKIIIKTIPAILFGHGAY